MMIQRHSTFFFLPLLAATWLLAWLAPAPAQAADSDRIETRVHRGHGGFMREFRWNPIRVKMRNWYASEQVVVVRIARQSVRQPDPVLTQRLTMPPRTDSSPQWVSLFFYLPPITPGEETEFVITVKDASGNTLLKRRKETPYTVRENGVDVQRIKVEWPRVDEIIEQATLPPDTYIRDERCQWVLCVAGSNLPGERTVRWREPGQTADSDARNMIVREDRVRMIPCGMDDLPDNWTGYDSLDAVFLPNPDWNQLRDRNRYAALRTWVRSGGHLILVMSEKIAEYRASRLDDDAGVSLLETSALDQRTLVTDGNVQNNVDLGVNLIGNSVPMLVVTPQPGVRTLLKPLGDGGATPLVLQRSLGLGFITTFTFDPTRSDYASNRRERLAPRGLDEFVADDVLLDAVRQEWFPRAEEQWDLATLSLHTNVQDGAGLLRKAQPVPFQLIAMFIGIYVLVIGPLDYLLLGMLNLRNVTWFTFAGAVLVFFLIAERGSEDLKGGEMYLRQLSVHTWSSDGTTERGDLVGGVYSQRNAKEVVWVDRPNARTNRFEPGTRYDENEFMPGEVGTGAVGAGEDLDVSQPLDAETLAHDDQIYLKRAQFFRWTPQPVFSQFVDDPADDGSARRLTVEAVGAHAIRITNNTDLPLDHVMVFQRWRGARSYRTVAWPAGDAIDAEGNTAPTPLQPGGVLDVTTSMSDGGRPTGWADVAQDNGPLQLIEVGNLMSATSNRGLPLNPGPRTSPEVGHVLAATFANRLRPAGLTRQPETTFEVGMLYGLDLSAHLQRGAIIVVGWTDDFERGQPLAPIRLETWNPHYEHTTVMRTIFWR